MSTAIDALSGVPKHLLGYEIKTRTQIIFTFLVPVCLELVAYLIQTVADTAVAVQHFRDDHPLYGALTVACISLPAPICFTSIMASPWQWPEVEGWSLDNFKFFVRHFFNLLVFPIGAIYRFCRRIFWSIESLFHEKKTYGREHSVSKAAETSPFELYHFVQAYVQAAPQIILQLYILLKENTFRNYETTNVQVLSVVFSFVNIATITMSYQRFERQKIVGRNYPWASQSQIERRRRKFQRTRSAMEEICESSQSRLRRISTFPENEKILHRFNLNQKNSEPELSNSERRTEMQYGLELEQHDKVNDIEMGNIEQRMHRGTDPKDEFSASHNQRQDAVDFLSCKNNNEESDLDAIAVADEISLHSDNVAPEVENTEFDTVPETSAPPPPMQRLSAEDNAPHTSTWQQNLNPIKQLFTFKDKLVRRVEVYIKEYVPRHPRPVIILQHTSGQLQGEVSTRTCSRGHLKNDISDGNQRRQISAVESGTEPESSAGLDSEDVTDFFFPTKRNMIKGVQQDDFIAKFVAFFGWIMFICMRMITLSVFAVFYPHMFAYLVLTHYCLMLVSLIYETKFQEKIERLLFYVFLSYVYIFVILEFRIKFKHLKRWYFGYFTLVMIQNISITFVWFSLEDVDSWWFYYMFNIIIASGALCWACILVYYCILRPNDVILLEN